jgi:hypothetical protein
MTQDLRQVISEGIELVEFHRYDTNGYIAGITGTVAAGAIAGAYRGLGIQTADPSIPEPEIISIPGDNGVLGGFIEDSTDVPRFNMDFGVQDFTLNQSLQGGTVYDDGDVNMEAIGPDAATLKDLLIILTSKSKTYSPTNKGTSLFSGYIVAKAQGKPLGRVGFEGRTGAIHRFQIVVNQSTQWGTGATMIAADWGFESAYLIPWHAQNRVTMDRITGNNSTATFSLNHKAVSSAKMRVRVNGTLKLTGWTLSTDLRSITFSPVLASDAVAVLYYEWVYN